MNTFFADKPQMDLSPHLSKAASNRGDTGRLVCQGTGAPELNFTWSRDGTIPTNTPQKYKFQLNKVSEN